MTGGATIATGRQRFLAATNRQSARVPAFGSGTSVVCKELMERVGVYFPEAHLNAEQMAALAMTGHTELGFDVVMPLFSVCHEAAAMGCNVHWGAVDAMPEAGKPIFETENDIQIPRDFLEHEGCAVPLKAIQLLKQRLGEDTAVCGKVFGSWTQCYHYFGIERFLMMTLTDAGTVHRLLDGLLDVSLAFARAQLDAGADCILVADHATRDLCSPQAYEEFLLPRHRRMAEEIDAPLLLHICGDTGDRIGMIASSGMRVFHWDTRTGNPAEVRALAGERMALMGGVGNYLLLRGRPDEVRMAAQDAIDAGIDIVGPECAIPLLTPLDNLKAIVSL